jgi:hypothetical protein
MLIDTIAERYGMLPSKVMSEATTFDIFVADAAIHYRNIQQERALGNKEVDPAEYSEEDLLKILKEERG